MTSTTRTRSTVVAAILALAIVATACGSDTEAADPIATNDGGVLVRPPDVLEGNPEPSPAPLDVPAPVDGLAATPVVEFTYFDGTAGSTSDFAGQPTILNFWASTCAACIAEMPEFEEAHQALGDSVNFIGMNVADVRSEADKLAAQTGVTYTLADDGQSQVFRSFGAFVMPTTVLLNPQGQVAFVWSGVLTGDELLNLVDQHILPGSI